MDLPATPLGRWQIRLQNRKLRLVTLQLLPRR